YMLKVQLKFNLNFDFAEVEHKNERSEKLYSCWACAFHHVHKSKL
ncbi:hypothetical protein DOY81_006255, partial [Sarcophaga bullata]